MFDGAGPATSAGVLSGRDLLDGSRFALTREEDAGGGTLAFWGHTAHARFDGTDTGNGAPVRLDGAVLTGIE